MGTGQLSLMVKKIRSIQKKELSIHFFDNGFSFCTYKNIDFIPNSNGIDHLRTAIKDYLDYYKKNSFNSFSVIFFQNPSTFVPKVFFDKSHIHFYLSNYKTVEKDEIVGFDILKNEKEVNVYSYPNKVRSILNELLINFKSIHYNSLLFTEIKTQNFLSKYPNKIFVHFHSKAMDIFLLNQKKLIFNNRFKVTNNDEFLYYIFFVIEQFELSNDQLEIIFLGKIKAFKNYHEIIKKYHSNINFIQDTSNLGYDLSVHQAPYLASYFS